eukprot:jgi/Phyca11/19193/fgenesh1_pg.PHYCAscaffold_46_\
MRLSQVLVIAVASFVFASDTVAVATSNQAKISKMEQSPSQRLLRSNHYPVKEEEDESEDSVDFEERGFTTPDEEDLEERSPLSSATLWHDSASVTANSPKKQPRLILSELNF